MKLRITRWGWPLLPYLHQGIKWIKLAHIIDLPCTKCKRKTILFCGIFLFLSQTQKGHLLPIFQRKYQGESVIDLYFTPFFLDIKFQVEYQTSTLYILEWYQHLLRKFLAKLQIQQTRPKSNCLPTKEKFVQTNCEDFIQV